LYRYIPPINIEYFPAGGFFVYLQKFADSKGYKPYVLDFGVDEPPRSKAGVLNQTPE
jgi:hypothetical protein